LAPLGQLAEGSKDGSLDTGVRVVVSGKLGDGKHVLTVGLESGVSGEESVVTFGEGVDHITVLEESEVIQRDVVTLKELLGSEVGQNLGGNAIHALTEDHVTIVRTEGGPNAGHKCVNNDLLVHDDLSTGFGGAAKELRGPFVANVDRDSFALGDLEISIDDVRKIGEVKTKALLVLFLPLCRVVDNVVTLVSEVDTSHVQDIAVAVSAGSSSDIPVAECYVASLCHL